LGSFAVLAVLAALAVEAAPLAAALQAFFSAANDHHGQRHNEATATKAPRLARVGKNTNNFTIIPDSITTVLRQFLEKISSNCRIVMCLVEPNDGDNTKGGSEAAFGRGSR